MRKWFTQIDARQRLRLRRTVLGYSSYLIFMVPLGYAQYFGWLEFGLPGLLLVLAAATLINLIFLALIVTGLNLRFPDPSMTLAQIATASVFAIILISYAEKARGVLLMLYFTSMFFGVFRLSTREFLGLTAFVGAGYFLMIRLQYGGQPFNEAYQLEILRFGTLMLVLIWLSLLGGYVASLRARLHERNRELHDALEAITAIARQDELTQTFNRRHMLTLIRQETERRRRYGGVFSICILDIDYFKKINDSYGHVAGDQVLREFVGLVEKQVRGPDFISRGSKSVETFGRYGGEEFILLMPQTDLRGALVCAERLRAATEAHEFDANGSGVRLTISLGVTEVRDTDAVDELIHRADEALYRAKRDGRNRVAWS